jgi:hypothetical protein
MQDMYPIEVTHISDIEGAAWIPWAEWKKLPVNVPAGKRIHALKWSNGAVWDAYNGWRKPQYEQPPRQPVGEVHTLNGEVIQYFSVSEGQELMRKYFNYPSLLQVPSWRTAVEDHNA